MAIAYRGTGTSGNSGGSGVTSRAITLPTGWQPGDILFVVLLTCNSIAQTFTQTGGTGTWTQDFSGLDSHDPHNYVVYHRIMQVGDTAPTFSWSNSQVASWSCGGFYSTTGATLSLDVYAGSDPLNGTSNSTSSTPNPATVTSGTEASIIMSCAQANSSKSTSSHTYTPPSGWTANDGNSGYFDGGSRAARFATHAYQLGVTGTVTPGSQTFTDSGGDTFWWTVFHALVHEGPSGPVVTTTSLPSGTIGFTYAATLTESGGTAPFTWTETGSLPPGVSMSSAGVFSGTPTTAGTYPITVKVTDNASLTATQNLSITINATLTGQTLPVIPPMPAGYVAQLSDMNALTYAVSFLMNKPIVHVHGTGTGAFPNTATAVVFDTKDYDTDGIWNTGFNTRLTIQTSGWYKFKYQVACVCVLATAASAVHCYLQSTTGASNPAGSGVVSSNQWGTAVELSNNPDVSCCTCSGLWPYYLYPGDYLQVFALSTVTGNSFSAANTAFALEWVSA